MTGAAVGWPRASRAADARNRRAQAPKHEYAATGFASHRRPLRDGSTHAPDAAPAPARRGRDPRPRRRRTCGSIPRERRREHGACGPAAGRRHERHPLRPLRSARSRDARPALPVREAGDLTMGIDRRTFLKGTAGAAAGIGMATVLPTPDAPPAQSGRDYDVPASLPVDRVVRTTCSPNCTGSCGQLAFVRDEVIVKIQQAADYPDGAYNPRGCMKGLSYVNHVYGDDRIRTPLIRTGDRGSGEFREATWEEVLDRIADDFRRIGETWGWDSIHVFGQVPGSGLHPEGRQLPGIRARSGSVTAPASTSTAICRWACRSRSASRTPSTRPRTGRTAGFILLVGSNPVETRIPDVHFIFDALEKGASLVVIDPSFSPTAAKADAHLRIRPGTDAALALGLCRQVIADEAWDPDFMRTYTDAPLLVRTDTGVRLREADLVAGGAADRFVAWDEAAGALVVVGTDRLGFPAGVQPALDGARQIELADGSTVEAKPGLRPRPRGAEPLDAGGHRDPDRRAGRDDHQGRPGLRGRQAGGDPHGRRLEPLVPRRPDRARLRPPRGAHRQHREVRRRLLRLRRPVQGPREHRPVVERGRDEGQGRPVGLLRPRPHRHDAPRRALPEERLARPLLHLRQHVRAGHGREPAPRDAGRPGPRRRGGPPDDRDGQVGRRGPARDDLVREDRPHGDPAPPVPPAPAGGDRRRSARPAPSSGCGARSCAGSTRRRRPSSSRWTSGRRSRRSWRPGTSPAGQPRGSPSRC